MLMRTSFLIVLPLLLSGCLTPARVDVVWPETETVDARMFAVTRTHVDSSGRAEAKVHKTVDAPGVYPIVFFRFFDEQDMTLRVVSAPVKTLANSPRGAAARAWATAPKGTRRVEVAVLAGREADTESKVKPGSEE